MKTKEINGFKHILHEPKRYSTSEMLERSQSYFEYHDTRRSVRDISEKKFPREVIDNIIKTASSAPSGAHKQPWTFCVIESAEIKSKIRQAAEKEEYDSYHGRMSDRWLDDLKPIGTDWQKPFLEKAPFLVVLFKRVYEMDSEKRKVNNYYVNESVGIAAGMFISAVHHSGLVTLTHTPSPMNFLSEILGRPANERAYLVMPVGFSEEEAYVPSLQRKKLSEVVHYY